MSNADQAMAQAIEHFQSGNVVAGMFDLAHAGGCDRLDRKHASGLAKGYSAHAIFTAMCEALWEHGEDPLADVVQRVHHKLAGKTAVSTAPEWSSSAKKDAAAHLRHETSFAAEEIKEAVNGASDDDGLGAVLSFAFPKLGARRKAS